MDMNDLVVSEDKRNKKEKEANADLLKLEKELKNNYYVYEQKKFNKWNNLIKDLDQMIKEESPNCIYKYYYSNFFIKNIKYNKTKNHLIFNIMKAL